MSLLLQKQNRLLLVIFTLLLLSAGYMTVTGSIVGSTTIQYDEVTDLVIASRLSEHPLSGHSYDGSQARFPMYVTAVAQRIMRAANPDLDLLETLKISRWASILMTVLAIWGTYLLGSRLFTAAVGLLAAALFTFSPLVLHFGRDALTQGDAFTPATVLLALLTFIQFQRERSTFWLFCFSFCLALAISAKFLLVILIPAFITYQLILAASSRYREVDPPIISADASKMPGTDRAFTVSAIGAGSFALLALLANSQRFVLPQATDNLGNQPARLFWFAALLCLLFCFWLAFRDFTSRHRPAVQADRAWSAENSWSLPGAWPAILALSFAFVLALFPEHIFNPLISSTLISRFLTMDGSGGLFASTFESAKLYLGLLLLKPGLPLGIATCVALMWAVKKSFRDKEFLLIVLVLFYYSLMLAVLPLQQPFWLMSVYPLILIALSAMVVQGFQRLKSNGQRVAWAGIVFIAVAWLIVGLVQVFPNFGYYGYETIGDEWLGNESRGFRKVVIVTNDGSTEAIDWLRQNARADATVVSYLIDVHLIDYLADVEPFAFDLKQALRYEDKELLMDDLAEADFVVVRVPDDVGFRAPVSEPTFVQQFGSTPVFQIWRGRGVYRMPVIEIYQRKSDRG